MSCISEVFGKSKVFLPVVHTRDEKGIWSSIESAMKADADGVFLINQGMSWEKIGNMIPVIRRQIPDLWIGVNLLGFSAIETLRRYGDVLDGLWTDSSHGVRPSEVLSNWRKNGGLWFGGVCFKYQVDENGDFPYIKRECRRVESIMDVVTTSGVGTGEAASLHKISNFRRALGARPLAIASGVTIDNVRDYSNVDAFLVATGVEQSFGVFDDEKLRTLSSLIHSM